MYKVAHHKSFWTEMIMIHMFWSEFLMYTKPYEHQIDSLGSEQCMKRFTKNSNFDVSLCKTALFLCKSSCTEFLKWLFPDSIHLLICKIQRSSSKLNVVVLQIHVNSKNIKIGYFWRFILDNIKSDSVFLEFQCILNEAKRIYP